MGKSINIMANPKIGLVTVLYNSESVLDDFFYSLYVQNYDNFYLYLVDNSSEEEPLEKAKILSKRYKIKTIIIDNKKDNVGVAKGNNQGIERALNDNCIFIGLINNDLIFDDHNTISKLVQSLLENKKKLFSPSILAWPENKYWYNGGYFNLFKGTTPHKSLIKSNIIQYAPTCFLFMDAKVFKDVGTMDEKYFAYYDDSDFIFRAHLKGYDIDVNRDVIIKHKVSTSTGGCGSIFSLYYGTRNRFYFINKNLTGIYKLSANIYTLLTRLVYILKPSTKNRKAIIRGICDYFKM